MFGKYVLTAVVVALFSVAPAMAAGDPNRLFADSHLVASDRFSVEVAGQGSDVVLIPGLASSRATFRRTAAALRANHRVHLIQIAGFSGEPAGANAKGPVFDPLVEGVSAYLKSLGKPVPVIGHSFGGTMGLAIAERHPFLMSKLMIVDALPFYGAVMAGPDATIASVTPIVAKMRSAPPRPQSAEAARGMASFMTTAPADVDQLTGWMQASDPAVVVAAMTDDMLADLRPGLAAVTTSVTVLYETPLKPMIESGYAPLKTAKLVEVPGAKHFIMNDQPARFDAEVVAFLK